MNQQLSAKATNFQDFLSSRGIEEKVVELSESTRTSAEAAADIYGSGPFTVFAGLGSGWISLRGFSHQTPGAFGTMHC